jgi:hypothetical protein
MATSTLIQFLAEGEGIDTSNRRQLETFLADGAIAEGAPVMFDIAETADGDKVLKVVESSADKAAIGVAIEKSSAGNQVRVCISGICEALVKGTNNAGNSAISAGDYLCQGDVAGEFYKYTIGADAVPHAVCVDAVSSGAAAALVTVIVLKQF